MTVQTAARRQRQLLAEFALGHIVQRLTAELDDYRVILGRNAKVVLEMAVATVPTLNTVADGQVAKIQLDFSQREQAFQLIVKVPKPPSDLRTDVYRLLGQYWAAMYFPKMKGGHDRAISAADNLEELKEIADDLIRQHGEDHYPRLKVLATDVRKVRLSRGLKEKGNAVDTIEGKLSLLGYGNRGKPIKR